MCVWVCICVSWCVCHIYAEDCLLSSCSRREELLFAYSLSAALSLSRRPPESYSCHSVTFPIHNWGVRTAQSPWNHVNHFQLLLLNNQAEPTVPGGESACAAACIAGFCNQSSAYPPLLSSPTDLPPRPPQNTHPTHLSHSVEWLMSTQIWLQ